MSLALSSFSNSKPGKPPAPSEEQRLRAGESGRRNYAERGRAYRESVEIQKAKDLEVRLEIKRKAAEQAVEQAAEADRAAEQVAELDRKAQAHKMASRVLRRPVDSINSIDGIWIIYNCWGDKEHFDNAIEATLRWHGLMLEYTEELEKQNKQLLARFKITSHAA